MGTALFIFDHDRQSEARSQRLQSRTLELENRLWVFLVFLGHGMFLLGHLRMPWRASQRNRRRGTFERSGAALEKMSKRRDGVKARVLSVRVAGCQRAG